MADKEDQSRRYYLGVRKVLIFRKLASRTDLALILAGIILLAWAKNWEGNAIVSVTPKVFSIFEALHLTSLLNVVLYILQTALLPIYSKVSDMVGRTEAFTIAIFFYVISGVVMATAQSMDTLVGGQVIYAFGISGVSVLGHVLIADMTSKVNRGLFQAFYDIPAIINIFAAPLAGQALTDANQWRWAYAMIPFCVGAMSVPLLIGLFSVEHKMKKSGLLKQDRSQIEKRTVREKVAWFCTEIDLVGSLLMVGALCMILLPLVLAIPKWGGWASATTIGTLVAGVVTAVLFGLWEWKMAEKPLIPFGNWSTLTPITGVLTCSTISMITAMNWQYFLTYLMVSRKVNQVTATYLEQGYHAAFLISQVIAGFLMKRYKVYRPFVFIGIVLYMIGIGLMIPARLPTSSNAFVVISQVIGGFGSGMVYVPILVAVQSSVPHNDLAIVTALVQIGGSIATSIGSTLAGATWNSMLPDQIAKNVPGEYDYNAVIGDVDVAVNLPDDQYNGVVHAYGYIQKILSIVSLCLAALAFFFFLGMRSFGLSDEDEKSIHEDDEKLAVDDHEMHSSSVQGVDEKK
ncbi:hypothetical protein DFQ28_011343 [Apophysomyces sp. BC1034]|nr:hypothetical protein DFQ30_003139 [Apophysomyces sp. BC1015]KAG0181204.1 hypothetical protein DFQ29_009075 [Apophysomyces sp. BC1021]KAG0191661.1 hypothetical protein DFQ28_011343 [Apophysomyces sp. BC1034]